MEQQKQTTTQLHQGRRVPRKKKGRRIVAVLAGLICLGAAAGEQRVTPAVSDSDLQEKLDIPEGSPNTTQDLPDSALATELATDGSSGSFVPQFGQTFFTCSSSGRPHLRQKRASALFSAPQCGQTIREEEERSSVP